jgi:hypothetical protein
MRKLIIGASIILIFISIYGLVKTVFVPPRVTPKPSTSAASAPAPDPNLPLASTRPAGDPTPQLTVTPATVTIAALEPLKIRVVKHQADQFREGALNKEELSAIQSAIKTILWSLNSDPKAAADEDYAAIVKECQKSGVHDLVTDLITEAVSNDYQPNNEVANVAYSAELNSALEKGDQSDGSNGKGAGEITAGQGTNVESGLPSKSSQPEPTTTTSSPSTERSASAETARSKVGHVRHRTYVRRKIVDVRLRLIALWHQSLDETEKSTKWTPTPDPHGVKQKND